MKIEKISTTVTENLRCTCMQLFDADKIKELRIGDKLEFECSLCLKRVEIVVDLVPLYTVTVTSKH